MDDGAALLLAVARYYTPTGKDIEEVGIEPQVKLSSQEEEVVDLSSEREVEIPVAPKKAPPVDEDRQLNKAIEILRDPQITRKTA
jgi:C-terminal processing protease CtpA/Prc